MPSRKDMITYRFISGVKDFNEVIDDQSCFLLFQDLVPACGSPAANISPDESHASSGAKISKALVLQKTIEYIQVVLKFTKLSLNTNDQHV